MLNSKFNLKINKVLLTLLTLAILVMSISSVSAAITVQFDQNTATQCNVDKAVVIRVYVQDSGNPVSGVDVSFSYDAVYDDPALKNQQGNPLGSFKTNTAGVATVTPFMGQQSSITYKAVYGGVSASHTIRYIDPNYKPIPTNPGDSNNGGSNQGGSNNGGSNNDGSTNGGSNNGGSNQGGSNSGTGNSDNLSLKKGVIYKNNKEVGFWDGKNAYTINSAGVIVISSSYTTQIKEAIAKGQIASSSISTTTTSKILNFLDKIGKNTVKNSAVDSLARIYTKADKRAIGFKLLTFELATGNLGKNKFVGNNVYISSNAIKCVLNDKVSKKYIGRKNIKLNSLKSVVGKGKSILRIKGKDNKMHFIAISKVSNKKVTVYDNTKTNKKVAIGSLVSYLKKNYKFSGVAITYNLKVGKSPSSNILKGATGI